MCNYKICGENKLPSKGGSFYWKLVSTMKYIKLQKLYNRIHTFLFWYLYGQRVFYQVVLYTELRLWTCWHCSQIISFESLFQGWIPMQLMNNWFEPFLDYIVYSKKINSFSRPQQSIMLIKSKKGTKVFNLVVFPTLAVHTICLAPLIVVYYWGLASGCNYYCIYTLEIMKLSTQIQFSNLKANSVNSCIRSLEPSVRCPVKYTHCNQYSISN